MGGGGGKDVEVGAGTCVAMDGGGRDTDVDAGSRVAVGGAGGGVEDAGAAVAAGAAVTGRELGVADATVLGVAVVCRVPLTGVRVAVSVEDGAGIRLGVGVDVS